MEATQMQQEAAKRGCKIVTISFNGPTHDPASRSDVIAKAKAAMTFLKECGAHNLVVFSPNRSNAARPEAFKSVCERFNRIGPAAGEMGFRLAYTHNIAHTLRSA